MAAVNSGHPYSYEWREEFSIVRLTRQLL